ncbi:RHS domain-containing protein, partial [Xenorhabdus sp. Vera]|uniref:RHS repeat domain-containing protein n=1 Tax=Xenorhabdus koppenhoeferi TaxID=351659 RepID=UPI00198B9CC9
SARVEKDKLHYIVSDHQGTPREMLSEEGVLVWAQRLTTWGKAEKSQVIASNNPDYHVDCNFRFCGQYADEESGLYYNRFRYYSPETAQYLSPDPLNLEGGFNPYGYVDNPVNFIDPFGLAKCHLDNPKKKVNSADVGDFVRTPTSHPDDFTKIKGGNYKNKNTNEIWSKSNTTHSDKAGEWKVGIGKAEPKPRHKITIGMSDGKIIKIDK